MDLQVRKCIRLVASSRSKQDISIIGTKLHINDIIIDKTLIYLNTKLGPASKEM